MLTRLLREIFSGGRTGKASQPNSTPVPAPRITWIRSGREDHLLQEIITAVLGDEDPVTRVDLQAIAEESARMRQRIQGQMHHTSFAHRQVLMDAAQVLDGVSSLPLAQRLLYVGVLRCRPGLCLELGSALGVSGMCISAALRRLQRGRMIGVEYEEWRARLADEAVKKFWSDSAVQTGRIEDVVPQAMSGQKGGIDFSFVDAVHKYEDTMGYHRLLAQYVNHDAVVVYDDLNWSDEMVRFREELCADQRISGGVIIDDRWGVMRYISQREPTQA